MRCLRMPRAAASRRPGAWQRCCAASFDCMSPETSEVRPKPDTTPADVDIGARAGKDAVTFTVWAPRHDSLALRLDAIPDSPSGWRDIPIEPQADGYFSVTVPGAQAGQRYWFKL